MKKVIVTTTINKPTKALLAFSQMPGWDLVVVGDLKTPHEDYQKVDCIYLTPEKQEELYPKLSELLGWKTIQRRNIGFAYAYNFLSPDLIATVDDDNIPENNWGREILINEIRPYTEMYDPEDKTIVFDPIYYTDYDELWHRGFPIQEVNNRFWKQRDNRGAFDVQANFWHGDPDIDAICRMTRYHDCYFGSYSFPFALAGFSPFNSQNTILNPNMLPDYFMFPFVGRMDDIWGSYYAEAVGHKVIYAEATVTQERNEHNLTADFEKEILGYTKTLDLLKALKDDSERMEEFVPERSWQAFQEYRKLF